MDFLMYKYKIARPTKMRMNKSVEGETIEMKVRRIVDNKEPITDGAPIIYGPKGEVMAGHDIRTDRFEIAVEATDAISKSNIAKGSEVTIEQIKSGSENQEEEN